MPLSFDDDVRPESTNTLSWLRRRNILGPSAGFSVDETLCHLTLVFSIKAIGHFPHIPVGLQERRPFWNGAFNENRVIWFRDLDWKTLLEARKIVLKYLDIIMGRILAHEAIVDVRVTLIDWTTDKAVPRSKLMDKWFTDRTFGGLIIDGLRCRSWGINVDHLETIKRNVDYANPLPQNTFDSVCTIPVDDLIYDAIAHIINSIPKKLKEDGVLQGGIAVAYARKIITNIRNIAYVKRIKMFLSNKFVNDSDFAADIADPSAIRNVLKKTIVDWIVNDVETRFMPHDE